MPDAMMVVDYLNCEKENVVNKSPSLIPWPPLFLFFDLRSHASGRVARNREGLVIPIMLMTSHRCSGGTDLHYFIIECSVTRQDLRHSQN